MYWVKGRRAQKLFRKRGEKLGFHLLYLPSSQAASSSSRSHIFSPLVQPSHHLLPPPLQYFFSTSPMKTPCCYPSLLLLFGVWGLCVCVWWFGYTSQSWLYPKRDSSFKNPLRACVKGGKGTKKKREKIFEHGKVNHKKKGVQIIILAGGDFGFSHQRGEPSVWRLEWTDFFL